MQFQSQLELPRIICGCCTTSIRPEGIHVRDVESIRDIKNIGAGLEVKAFAEINPLGNSQVVEDGPRPSASVASEISIQRNERSIETIDETWQLEAASR